MILLSLILVIAAAVLLVIGWFQDGLSLIYLSIGACLVAMLLLGASVLLRRRDRGPAPTSPIASGTAPASASASTRRTAVVRRPETDPEAEATTDEAAAPAGDAVATAPAEATTDDARSGPEPDADPLADVRGLGPSRREALLEHFGTLDAIRDASLEDLTAVPGISPGLAKAVQDRLA